MLECIYFTDWTGKDNLVVSTSVTHVCAEIERNRCLYSTTFKKVRKVYGRQTSAP